VIAALTLGMGFNAIHFAVGFIVLCCVLAICIIVGRWVLSLTGLAIPQPLLLVLGILLFLFLMLALLQYSGLYSF
jgi:uncharacterized membrane protein